MEKLKDPVSKAGKTSRPVGKEASWDMMFYTQKLPSSWGELTPGDDELFPPIADETLLAQGSLSEPDLMVVLETVVQADDAVII